MKKTINKAVLKIVGITIIIVIAGFTIYQSQWLQDRKQNIIGTWACDSAPNWKLEFTDSGICFWHSSDGTIEEFTYSISSEFAPNGSEHTFLKLIAVSSDVYDPGEVVEYAINSLGDDKMTLETIQPKLSYIYFTRE
ncbi:MAG: hypothetical protein GKR88_18005 [Flavobacteriaceae bacterium]|nr:MAG: hypothetical protein GKR88_18005 [Flavobacteriaceae bacterium]